MNPPIPALKDGKIEIKSQALEYLTEKEDKITHTPLSLNEEELSLKAMDFAFGGGKLWMVTYSQVYVKDANRWKKVEVGDRKVQRITVDSQGTPYVLTLDGEIFYKEKGKSWKKFQGPSAKDIGWGGGNLYIIATGSHK